MVAVCLVIAHFCVTTVQILYSCPPVRWLWVLPQLLRFLLHLAWFQFRFGYYPHFELDAFIQE